MAIYIDGAARDNPGPAGIGVVLKDGDRVIAEISEYIGRTTNNVAEYRALLRGLEEAKALGARAVDVRSDSELLVRQLKREYKVKSPDLSPLYLEANRLLTSFARYAVHKVPRGENAAADALANRAIDAAVPESTLDFSVLVEPVAGGFVARVPALGVIAEGKTRSEALDSARRAVVEEVRRRRAAHRPLPREERIRVRIGPEGVE
ncbi:MAG: ribonuclease HI family protein [Armatimonadota bacterium]|nr:ribonuclease HI family protein [Armatimonadota bacterium]